MSETTTNVQDAEVVVPAPVTLGLEKIKEQKANFQAQLDQTKKDMTNLQQQFEAKKTLAIKLEGALESLQILEKYLVK